MKSNKRKLFFIMLPIVVLALLLVVFVCVIGEEKEPVINNGIKPLYIEHDGFKYFMEFPLQDGNMFFEVQDGWAELDPETVKYMNFFASYLEEGDVVYYDTARPFKADLYLRVNEQWLKKECNISDHEEGFVRFHVHSGVG